MKVLAGILVVILLFTTFEVAENLQDNCPYQGCECFEGTIGCGARGWKTLPQLPDTHVDGLSFLDLDFNPLTTIQAGSLPAPISGINFEDTPLLNIDDAAFDGSSDTMTRLLFASALFTRIPNALGHLNALEILSIRDTLIEDWNVDVMKQIGKTVTTLTLDNVGLSAWPTFIQYFPRLQTLEVTNFNISTLPDNALDKQVNNLFTLTLEDGLLTEIPKGVWKLAALNDLVLDTNRITAITQLPGNLSSLSINNNSLSDAKNVSDSLRAVSDSLTVLQLRNNKLAAFPDMSFMKNLQSVYCANNEIFNTISGSIPPSVKFLELEGNNFQSVPFFLSTSANLETLRMARNAVTEIMNFQLPVSVFDLDFTRNMITELNNQSFPENSQLEYLVLDYNPISRIEALAFAVLKHMQFLSLRDTKLTRLPLAVTALTQLNAVDLTLNSDLVCTCLEKSVRTWALAVDVQIYGECGHVNIHDFLMKLSTGCPD